MAVLSDSHDHEFGPENKDLIEKVKEWSPDIIAMDVDIINKDSEDPHVALD